MPTLGKTIVADDPGYQAPGTTVSQDIAKEVVVYGYDGSSYRAISVDSQGNLNAGISVTKGPYTVSVGSVNFAANDAAGTSHKVTVSEPGAGNRSQDGLYTILIKNPSTQTTVTVSVQPITVIGGITSSHKLTSYLAASNDNTAFNVQNLFPSKEGTVFDFINVSTITTAFTLNYVILGLK